MATKNLFSNGQELDHSGHPLVIEKNLASGLTGEVYRGQLSLPNQPAPVTVAVKAMKTLDFPLARQMFYREGETLAFLMHLEEETKDGLDETLKIAPAYYGLSEYHPEAEAAGIPYLVMEFIAGEEVSALLKRGVFSEKQALVLAWHLYRVLDILHTRLQKTFIDLKFENLWWVENKSKWGGQLKLTDFGTLEEIKGEQKRGIARDLLLGGVYLLSALTNRTLEYSIGELKEAAEPVIKQHETQLTWGTRRLLKKLLHRNAEARPKSAAEVLAEVRQLVNFWVQPEEVLLSVAQKSLKTAEDEAEKAKISQQPLSKTGFDAAVRAYSALEILKQTAPALFNERDVERAKSVLAIGDYFERGSALLQGRSFTLARQTFEEGILWADDPAILRRWSFAARIGEEVPPKDFEARFGELKKLLDFINDPASNPSKWPSARRDFADLANATQGLPALKSNGLDYLVAECELYDLYEQATTASVSDHFQAAADKFGKIKTILDERLPADAAQLIEAEFGSLSATRRNAERSAAKEQALHLYAEAQRSLEAGQLAPAVEAAEDAHSLFRALPRDEFHLEQLARLSRLALKLAAEHPQKVENYVRAARQMAEIGLYEDASHAAYLRWVMASGDLDAALEKAAIYETAGFCASLEAAHAALGDEGALIEPVAVSAVNRALEAKNVPFVRGAATCLEKLLPASPYPGEWKPKADEIFAQQASARHAEVDQALDEARLALLPILQGADEAHQPKVLEEILRETARLAEIPQAFDLLALRDRLSRLEAAKTALGRAAHSLGTGDDYRWNEIVSLGQAVENGLKAATAAVGTQSQAQRRERIARVEWLSQERQKLEKDLIWVNQGTQLGFSEALSQDFYPILRQKLIDFLYHCYQVEAGDREALQEAVERQKQGETVAALEQVSVQVFIRWAQDALDSLGVESWKIMASLAVEQRQKIEAEFKQASKAFAEGDFGRLAAELDRIQSLLGKTPEWVGLKAGLAQAQAWRAWCETHPADFAAELPDRVFLRDLRAFAKLGLPAVYWTLSPAPACLERAEKTLKDRFLLLKHAPASEKEAREFLETLRNLLNLTWTKALALNPARRAWNKADWLKSAYALASQRDFRGLLTLVSQTLPPENLEEALNSFDAADWMQLRQADEKRRKAAATRRALLIGAGVTLLALVVLAIVALILYRTNQPYFDQQIRGTYTPPPSLTPSITPTPSLTPTPTLTPTATPTPTAIPGSAYRFGEINTLYPPVPVQGEAAWVINNLQATFDPPFEPGKAPWKAAKSEDSKANQEGYAFTATGPASVSWAMDVPFDAPGYYALYVVDTYQQSKGPAQFQVKLDGQPAQPYRGSSQVIFRGNSEVDRADTWLSLGVYQANAGQKLEISVSLGELTEQTPFAADRVLIVRLDETARQLLEALPAGRTLVSLLDDPDAQFIEVIADQPTPVKDRGAFFTDVLAWNGSLSSRTLAEALNYPLWVDWKPVNRLPPGKYEVLAWIPQTHATIVAEYALLADGKEVERPNPAQINQADHAGVWLSLGTWDLTQEAAVGLRLKVVPGLTGEVGVDAVAIVAVGQ